MTQGIISENTPLRKGCFGDYNEEIAAPRKCGACMDFEECNEETDIRKSFIVDLSSISNKIEAKSVKAVKLDKGKRQYSLIIPDLIILILPKEDNWIKDVIVEMSKAAHESSQAGIRTHCRAAIANAAISAGSYTILDEITIAMEYGIQKYGRNNWKKGMEWSRLIDAAMRHGIAALHGEIIDPDSGNTHIAHMLASIHMLIGNIEMGVGVDDITGE